MSTEGQFKYVDLNPVYHPTDIFDEVEARLEAEFYKGIYLPLLRQLKVPASVLSNSPASDFQALRMALENGQVTYSRGAFRGKKSASIARVMRVFGAKFDPATQSYKIELDDLPSEVQRSVASANNAFVQKMGAVDKHLKDTGDRMKGFTTLFHDLFDQALVRSDKSFRKNVGKLTVVPEVTPEQRKAIAKDWQGNMDLWIKGWEEKEIKSLREKVKVAYLSGNRYEYLIGTVQESHDTSQNHARFLARQETKLLVSTYTRTQYQGAGFNEYRWRNVVGSPAHPVRPMHAKLNNTIQSWNAPPVTDEKGNRNHAGCDFGCRCYPVVLLKVPA